MAKELKDYSKDEFLNRPIKPDTHKAIKDAYDATYKRPEQKNDMKMMTNNIDPNKVRESGPIMKSLVERVLRLEEERNSNGEVY